MLKNFRNDILYDIQSFKSVFLMREPRIPTFRQIVTSKHQNNVVLAKLVSKVPKTMVLMWLNYKSAFNGIRVRVSTFRRQMTLNTQNDVISEKTTKIQEIKKFLLKTSETIYYMILNHSKVFFLWESCEFRRYVKKWRQNTKLTSKHQNNVVLVKLVFKVNLVFWRHFLTTSEFAALS